MKLSKIFAAAIILASAAYTGCNLDFSNLCEDKWVVTNYYTEALNIKFGDSTTAETIAAATLNGTTLTPATDTFSHKADTSITIENDYIAYTESFSYSDSKAKRTLVIKEADKYVYRVSNTLGNDITFKLNASIYPFKTSDPTTIIEPGTKDAEGNITYTIKTGKETTFTIYKNQPSFIFNSTATTFNTSTTKGTNGSAVITIY